MKKAFYICTFLVIVSLTISGCSLESILPKAPGVEEEGIEAKKKSSDYNQYVTNEQDEKYKKKIVDYMKELYKDGVSIRDSYNRSLIGNIPDELQALIYKPTIDEGLGNPQIPIHLPRFVELNGYTLIDYSIIKDNKTPKIEANFLEMDGNKMRYFVTVDLLARCLKNSDFENYFKIDPGSGFYNEIPGLKLDGVPNLDVTIINEFGEVVEEETQADLKMDSEDSQPNENISSEEIQPEENMSVEETQPNENILVEETNVLIDPKEAVPKSLVDFMKVRVKYDIEIIEEKGDIKIYRAIETNVKLTNNYRVVKYNNDFMIRLQYLDSENKKEEKRQTHEKEIITKYFDKFLEVDKVRMDYLKTNWNINIDAFEDIISKYRLNVDDDLGVLIHLDKEYKTNFKINEFPLQNGMKSINKFDKFEVIEHPSYTENVNAYIVSITATYQDLNGTIEINGKCNYIYDVLLTTINGKKFINTIKLVEYKLQRD